MGQGLKPPCSGWLLLAQKGLMLRSVGSAIGCVAATNSSNMYNS